MKAIILSAGQGSRLLPLTNEIPKCLLPVGEKTVLQWQLEAIDQVDEIDEIVVITGFMAHKVEAAINQIADLSTRVTTLLNPFFELADNLASCWMAREYMNDDFLIINGDSLFERAVLPHVINNAAAPINLTINFKSKFDSDDMKVTLDGERIAAVGKSLLPSGTHAESIGIVLFRGIGCALFREELEAAMRDGSGINAWYLQAIDRLAKRDLVGAVDIGPLEWCEIDFPSDLEMARRMIENWARLRVVA